MVPVVVDNEAKRRARRGLALLRPASESNVGLAMADCMRGRLCQNFFAAAHIAHIDRCRALPDIVQAAACLVVSSEHADSHSPAAAPRRRILAMSGREESVRPAGAHVHF